MPTLPAPSHFALLGASAVLVAVRGIPPRWRPPRVATWAWLAVASHGALAARSHEPAPPLVLAGSTHAWVEVTAGPPACVRGTTGGPTRIDEVIEVAGARGPFVVDAGGGAAAELAQRLGVAVVDACPALDRAAVREVLRACAARARAPRVVVRAHGRLECRVGTRWEPLPATLRVPGVPWSNETHR
jgi:hypothetical protein